jgi:hypothetical protein
MRVAMISPCVPASESLDVIQEQLGALAGVAYPHDSWILDEAGSPEVRALALAHGVRYFTRRGVERWNQPKPPFQAATKAGNVNAWLDHRRADSPSRTWCSRGRAPLSGRSPPAHAQSVRTEQAQRRDRRATSDRYAAKASFGR